MVSLDHLDSPNPNFVLLVKSIYQSNFLRDVWRISQLQQLSVGLASDVLIGCCNVGYIYVYINSNDMKLRNI